MTEAKQDSPATEAPAPNPARTEPGRAAAPADRALAEVRAIRAANEARTRAHSRTEIDHAVSAPSPDGEDHAPITLTTVDGRLFLDTHGPRVLDQTLIVDLQRKLASAFQAVS